MLEQRELTFEGENTNSAAGGGLFVGYGINRKVTLFAQADGETDAFGTIVGIAGADLDGVGPVDFYAAGLNDRVSRGVGGYVLAKCHTNLVRCSACG